MKDLFDRARKILIDTGNAGMMYAATKESLVNRVATVLEVLGIQFDLVQFYVKHLDSTNEFILSKLTDDWSRSVVDDAVSILDHYIEIQKDSLEK